MSTLAWNDSLVLNCEPMDHTHREFVELLGAVERALDGGRDEMLAHYAAFITHTQAHFDQEERWMAELGFEAGSCHAFQHSHVLAVLRQVQRKLAEGGDARLLRGLVHELALWLPRHAQDMDERVADLMNARGFDPATGALRPAASGAAPVASGCGGGHCG